jgi:hypothetical protein
LSTPSSPARRPQNQALSKVVNQFSHHFENKGPGNVGSPR